MLDYSCGLCDWPGREVRIFSPRPISTREHPKRVLPFPWSEERFDLPIGSGAQVGKTEHALRAQWSAKPIPVRSQCRGVSASEPKFESPSPIPFPMVGGKIRSSDRQWRAGRENGARTACAVVGEADSRAQPMPRGERQRTEVRIFSPLRATSRSGPFSCNSGPTSRMPKPRAGNPSTSRMSSKWLPKFQMGLSLA
jgi:hypothetical protein